MRVKTYKEALVVARCAGEDSAKRRMRKASRKVMSQDDYDHAVEVMEKVLLDLGFDTRSWMAMAGVPRNEPEPQKPARKSRRRSNAAPVQLAFGFA